MKRFVLVIAAACMASPAFSGGRKPEKTTAVESLPAAPAVVEKERPQERAASGQDDASLLPIYLSELDNPNDFTLFANGAGWDGNWYVGHNTCWVSQLPPVPEGDWARAFVGAKLGRMKTEPVPGKPSWERRPISGDIGVGVSDEPTWPARRRFLLTNTEAIPLDGDPENAVEGVGESKWFWAEVPLSVLSSTGPHYVALYSPSAALSDAQHAPILAAGWGDKRTNTWLNSSVKGEPPANPKEALKTPVSYFEPALAIKLIPKNNAKVRVAFHEAFAAGDAARASVVVRASVMGTNIDRAWVEVSTDNRRWHRASPMLSGAPFIFTVKRDSLPAPVMKARIAARDVLENAGVSETFTIHASTQPAKQ